MLRRVQGCAKLRGIAILRVQRLASAPRPNADSKSPAVTMGAGAWAIHVSGWGAIKSKRPSPNLVVQVLARATSIPGRRRRDFDRIRGTSPVFVRLRLGSGNCPTMAEARAKSRLTAAELAQIGRSVADFARIWPIAQTTSKFWSPSGKHLPAELWAWTPGLKAVPTRIWVAAGRHLDNQSM